MTVLDSAATSLFSFELETLGGADGEAALSGVLDGISESGAIGRDDLSRYSSEIVTGVRQGRFLEAGLWRNQLVEKVRGALEARQQSLGDLIKEELVDPDFDESKRRSGHSIIRGPYRAILDPFFDAPYPLNAFGTFCRILPDYLESFVNMGELIQRMLEEKLPRPLGNFLEEAAKDETAYACLRLAIRETLHAIGDLSYTYEWRDPRTYGSIDTLLEGLVKYSDLNRETAEKLKPKLAELFSSRAEIWVLDLGSGVGGTSCELLRVLDEMEREGTIPSDYRGRIHLILFDVSETEMEVAERRVKEMFKVSNVYKILGNFGDMEKVLEMYNGKINVVISGAAICHVTRKKRFFRQLYHVMAPGSVLSMWDAAISLNQSHYLRASPDSNVRIRYRYSAGSGDAEFVINKGEILPVGAVRTLADKRYETTVEVPYDEIIIWSAELVHMHMGQMGYCFPNISREEEERLKMKLQRDMLEGVKTAPGFNLIRWYRENLIENPKIPKISVDQTTPYDLIESISDLAEQVDSLMGAGFVNLSHVRHHDPVAYDNTKDAVRSNVVHFYAEKVEDSV